MDWAILLGSFLEAEQTQHTASFSLLPLSMQMCCLKDPACIWELKRKPWSTGGSSPRAGIICPCKLLSLHPLWERPTLRLHLEDSC